MHNAEIRLYQAIVLNAVQDALRKSFKRHKRYHKDDAIKKIFKDKYFEDVCVSAGFDPDWVKSGVLKVLKNESIISNSLDID